MIANRARAGVWLARVTSQLLRDVPTRFPPNSNHPKQLYLTIDDGPTAVGTPALLDVCARFDVPATFFLLGAGAARHRELVVRTADAGHIIGNHSFSHVNTWATPQRAQIADFARGAAVLEDITGSRVRWVRPPFGKLTPSLVVWARRRGNRILLWDAMPPDFVPGMSPVELAADIVRNVRPGSVICVHDNPIAATVTPDALRLTIPKLVADGYRFSPLPELN